MKPKNYFQLDKGKPIFMGGHFNIWNRRVKTTENFAIEFDFTPLSPAPLHMLMACASGPDDESVLMLLCPSATVWRMS